MIKPLKNYSGVAFKSGLEDYKQQVKNGTPKYQLTLSPGSNPPPAQKKSLKSGLAGIAKGFNNITGVAAGAAKGIGKGIIFGSLAGVVAKNFKENLSSAVTEEGAKKIKNLAFGQFFKGMVKDLWSFVGKSFTKIGEAFQQTPKDTLKDIVKLPKKYMEYLGKGNKAVKAAAIGVGALTVAGSILSAKIKANRKNADIDHSLNLKH